MRKTEMMNRIREVLNSISKYEYEMIGLRFENKDREIGNVCENSKDNPDRLDERDFPDYNSEDYNELPTLNGTCAWDLRDINWIEETFFNEKQTWNDVQKQFKHCYIIANRDSFEYGDDDNEVIIQNAFVIAKIF